MKNKKRELTETELVTLRELKSNKVTVKNIALQLGYNVSAIERFISKHKIYTKEVQLSSADFADIQILIKNRVSQKDIAREYKISTGKLQNLLKKENIKTKRYIVNHNYFEVIDTEDKAYFLGFMYADGYNNAERNQIKLKLLTTDLHIMESLARKITTGQLPPITVEKGTNCSALQIYSKQLCSDLERHGCGKEKAHTLKFPTFMSKELTRHFIRGYFDGDGSIFRANVSKSGNMQFNFTGTETFIKELQVKLLEYIDITKTVVTTNEDNHAIFTNSKVSDVYLMRDFLYKNTISEFRLKRKYMKFNELEDVDEVRSNLKNHYFEVIDTRSNTKEIYYTTYKDLAELHNLNIDTLYRGISCKSLMSGKYLITDYSKKYKYIIINEEDKSSSFITDTLYEVSKNIGIGCRLVIDSIQNKTPVEGVYIVIVNQ